jgi:hypothetical protein
MFEKLEGKSSKNSKENRKLMNDHCLAMKLVVLYVNKFYSTKIVCW